MLWEKNCCLVKNLSRITPSSWNYSPQFYHLRDTKYMRIIQYLIYPSSGKQLHRLAYLLHVPHSPLHSQWLLRSLVCSAGKQQSSLFPLLLPLLLLLLLLHWLAAELVSLWMLAAGSVQHQASLRLSETVTLLACHQILYHPAKRMSQSKIASSGSSALRLVKRQCYKETKQNQVAWGYCSVKP